MFMIWQLFRFSATATFFIYPIQLRSFVTYDFSCLHSAQYRANVRKNLEHRMDIVILQKSLNQQFSAGVWGGGGQHHPQRTEMFYLTW